MPKRRQRLAKAKDYSSRNNLQELPYGATFPVKTHIAHIATRPRAAAV